MMIPRRKALHAAAFGSLAALAVTTDAAAGQAAAQSSRGEDENTTRIVTAFREMEHEREELSRVGIVPERRG